MLNVMLNSVSFVEKHDVAEHSRSLIEKLLCLQMHILSEYLMKTLKFQLKERRNEDLRIAEPIQRFTERSYLTFCSSVRSPERKDQISGEKEQSVCHRAVPRSSTMFPNDKKHDDDEG
ncbi:hypothetical protein H5410_030332 [Solanum commersonii]|uniref:Uncharacterized protein n=1 Tax=Solanum commersonii TaxID=4109 RepID=A0A9J5YFE1_SOLCO|nr:hypothetical protein H5410_030332 [Solanum commersonii]